VYSLVFAHSIDLSGASNRVPPVDEVNTGAADVSLDLRTSLMDMNLDRESPLSSLPPHTQDIEMDPPLQYVKDFELAAELDAAEGQRHSCEFSSVQYSIF
jgi:hypothetical protein